MGLYNLISREIHVKIAIIVYYLFI